MVLSLSFFLKVLENGVIYIYQNWSSVVPNRILSQQVQGKVWKAPELGGDSNL